MPEVARAPVLQHVLEGPVPGIDGVEVVARQGGLVARVAAALGELKRRLGLVPPVHEVDRDAHLGLVVEGVDHPGLAAHGVDALGVRAGAVLGGRHDGDLALQLGGDHGGADGRPLDGGEDLALREDVDAFRDADVGGAGRAVLQPVLVGLEGGGVAGRVEDALDLARRRVPQLAAAAPQEVVEGAGREVVDAAVLLGEAPHALVGTGEEGRDLLEVVHRQVFEVFEGLRQGHVVLGLEGLLLLRVLQHVLAHEQRLDVALLRQAPDVLAAVGIGHVGVDDGLGVPVELQVGVLGDDVVELQDPAGLGERAEPLGVRDDDVVFLGAGGERGRRLLEQVREGRLGEGEGNRVAVFLLHEVGEERRHLHAERRGQPAGDA